MQWHAIGASSLASSSSTAVSEKEETDTGTTVEKLTLVASSGSYGACPKPVCEAYKALQDRQEENPDVRVMAGRHAVRRTDAVLLTSSFGKFTWTKCSVRAGQR